MILSNGSTIVDKNNETNDKFYRKVTFLMYTELFNFRPQTEKQLRNENHTEGWALVVILVKMVT